VIISRTPFRVSFFGGGTDFPAWYQEHGGAVLATTIDKYCYLTCRHLPPFFEHKFRLIYSKIENRSTIDEIEHPTARETLRYLDFHKGVEIHHDADLPARSGTGSSSAFTVGLLHALHALQGRMVGKQQLFEEALHIEQTVLREAVGSQDQAATAYGGVNLIRFHQSGAVTVTPVPTARPRLNELNSHLLLVYSGIKRTSADIAESYAYSLDQHRRQLRLLGSLTEEALALLTSDRDLSDFGTLLDEAWQIKRSFSSSVSNDAVDSIYQRALKAGATGGKLLGAGGGGFMLFFAPPERHAHIRAELDEFIHVPFRFEFSGSQIIFMDRQEEYADLGSAVPKARFRELDNLADG
jgi:D-glycero-alpha-D-manno-heptose-7-phosphate kinase